MSNILSQLSEEFLRNLGTSASTDVKNVYEITHDQAWRDLVLPLKSKQDLAIFITQRSFWVGFETARSETLSLQQPAILFRFLRLHSDVLLLESEFRTGWKACKAGGVIDFSQYKTKKRPRELVAEFSVYISEMPEPRTLEEVHEFYRKVSVRTQKLVKDVSGKR